MSNSSVVPATTVVERSFPRKMNASSMPQEKTGTATPAIRLLVFWRGRVP